MTDFPISLRERDSEKEKKNLRDEGCPDSVPFVTDVMLSVNGIIRKGKRKGFAFAVYFWCGDKASLSVHFGFTFIIC